MPKPKYPIVTLETTHCVIVRRVSRLGSIDSLGIDRVYTFYRDPDHPEFLGVELDHPNSNAIRVISFYHAHQISHRLEGNICWVHKDTLERDYLREIEYVPETWEDRARRKWNEGMGAE